MELRRILLVGGAAGLMVLAPGLTLAQQVAELPAETAGAAAGDDSARGDWFPSGTLMPAPIADLKEPRFYSSFRRARFESETPPALEQSGQITVALVGLGTEFGIWGRRGRSGDGLQVDLMAGVFSQFELSTSAGSLINSDFIIGPQFTYRTGGFTTRWRAHHQSSHLGDGLLQRADELAEELNGSDPSFEALDVLLSGEGSWWRVYAGGSYVFNTVNQLAPWQTAGGLEVRGGEREWRGVRAAPLAAMHVEALEERGWGTTTSVMAGVTLRRPASSRGLRFSLVYLDGFTPFGQFFTDVEVQSYGVQLELLL